MNTDPIYGPILLPEVTIKAPKKRGFWEQFNLDRRERHRELSKSPSGALWAPFESLLELPQAAMSYYLTSPVTSPQNPSTLVDKSLGIENPYLALASTVVLDPLNFVGSPAKVPKTLKRLRGIKKLSSAEASAALVKDVSTEPFVRNIVSEAFSSLPSQASKEIMEKLPVVSLGITDLRSPVSSVANIHHIDALKKSLGEFGRPIHRRERLEQIRPFLQDLPVDPISLESLRHDYPISLEVVYPTTSSQFPSSLAHEAAHIAEYFSSKPLSKKLNRELDTLTDGYFSNSATFTKALENVLLQQELLRHNPKADNVRRRVAYLMDKVRDSAQALLPSTKKVADGQQLYEALLPISKLGHADKPDELFRNWELIRQQFHGRELLPRMFQAGYVVDYDPVLKIGESYAHMKELPFAGLAPFIKDPKDYDKITNARKVFLDIYNEPSRLASALQGGLYSMENAPTWLRRGFGDLRLFSSIPPTTENVEQVLRILKNLQ